jgi:hypothetical protein
MFLVPIFFEIVKNSLNILKMVKKNPINFSVIKNSPFRLYFFTSANRMINSRSLVLTGLISASSKNYGWMSKMIL